MEGREQMRDVASVDIMTTSHAHHEMAQAEPQAPPAGQHHRKQLSDYDDEALMLRAQQDDKEAFETLVRRYLSLVQTLATRILGHGDAGRDAAQEVFLDLWLHRERYRNEGRFRSYLTTLVLNRCRDATRRAGAEQRRRDGLAREKKPPPPDPTDGIHHQQSSQQLQQALEQLEAPDRELLVMRYGMELGYEEIATQTGRPTGTLRSRVFHVLKKLRRHLEGES
jgi:RNA polymerase sigma-70 factor (ECF subfamily)